MMMMMSTKWRLLIPPNSAKKQTHCLCTAKGICVVIQLGRISSLGLVNSITDPLILSSRNYVLSRSVAQKNKLINIYIREKNDSRKQRGDKSTPTNTIIVVYYTQLVGRASILIKENGYTSNLTQKTYIRGSIGVASLPSNVSFIQLRKNLKKENRFGHRGKIVYPPNSVNKLSFFRYYRRPPRQ